MFVHDIRLEDVREAIKGRTDFRECQYEDHIIFVYFLGMGTKQFNPEDFTDLSSAKDIFPDPETAPDERTRLLWRLRRECRGNVFSRETGKLICRRFHKFFNGNRHRTHHYEH